MDGWKQLEDGRWTDGETTLDSEGYQELASRPTGYDFTGPDGRTYMVTADRGWNDPAAPGRYGLTAADTALAPDNANPAWMPGDRGVLYDKAPQFDSSSIFDFGPLLLAAFMVPAIASSLAAAPAVGAVAGAASAPAALPAIDAAYIAQGIGPATELTSGFTAAAGAAEGAAAAGPASLPAITPEYIAQGVGPSTQMTSGFTAPAGIIGSGGTVAAPETAAAALEAAPLSAGQEAAQSIANEWTAPNVFDDLAFDPMAGQVGGDGIGTASTVESTAATRAGDITDLAKAPTPPSNTQDTARRLVQSAEDVTNAEGGSGAWPASSSPSAGGSLLDRIWRGVTSPQGIGASINVIGGTIGGMGIAGINRKTMEKKSELDLQNAQAMQQFRTDQSRQNMFKGIIGVRPAATRAPLQRLTGGSVYGPTGLIRRA